VISVTALTADVPYAAIDSGPDLRGASTVRTMPPERSGGVHEDRSAAVTSSRTAVRSWPLLVLAVPAAAEVWSGWVGIARLTGFGMVSPLPGIWPSLHLDTSITLPVGVEAYAAYALRAWLAGEDAVSPRTRRFAKWSAMLSFALGMAGQVTYHLLASDGVTRAPSAITTVVSCLPVLVLAMGTALAHLLRDDARTTQATGDRRTGQPDCWSVSWSPEDQTWSGPGQEAAEGPAAPSPPAAAGEPSVRDHLAAVRTSGPDSRAESSPAEQARLVARRLAAAGKPVSRRALRGYGVRGSNEALNKLARELNAEPTSPTVPPAGI
jgi:hypothetical protein